MKRTTRRFSPLPRSWIAAERGGRQPAFDFFTRTSMEFCLALGARDQPESGAVLRRLLRRIDDRRLRGALEAAIAPDEAVLGKLVSFEHELSSIAEAQVDMSNGATFMLDGAVGYITILQSKTINLMTILGVLLTPPVLVASVYGMNFKHMPELDWQLGYLWAMALMVASAGGMYLLIARATGCEAYRGADRRRRAVRWTSSAMSGLMAWMPARARRSRRCRSSSISPMCSPAS